jgi:hypothetical protein
MVNSILDKNIKYAEKNALIEEDINYETDLYEISLLGIDIDIAVGMAKYDYVEQNIIYYPVYLVKESLVVGQIGVYEIVVSEMVNVVDKDNMLDLTLINKILPYSFVTKSFISKEQKENVIICNDGDDENDDDNDGDGDGEKDKDDEKLKPLSEQTIENAQEEQDEYKNTPIKPLLWINKFMQNNNYGLIDNEGKGDCLFAVIRDALSEVKKELTVAKMRDMLADNATDALLTTYITLYQNIKTENNELTNELKTLVSRHKKLKEELKQTKDVTLQSQLLIRIEELQKKHKETKQLSNHSKQILTEFEFIKNITTLPKLKEKIKTCQFWGDTWAISTLERVLNIKLIILSNDSYDEEDEDNVLQCGQLNDTELENQGQFNPSHYIIISHGQNHYKLITYKNHRSFSYVELPYDIKNLIVNKCLEQIAGPYSIIPEFLDLNLKIEKKTKKQSNITQSITTNTITNMSEEQSTNTTTTTTSQANESTTIMQSDLYIPNGTVLQFYSKSNDKPAPGMGAGEQLGVEGIAAYSELKRIISWRKMLSNFWESSFVLHGHKWLSVEHYYQGSKFKKNNPEFYLQFSLDSNSELSKNVLMSKSAGGKTGKFKGNLIRPKNITADDDFFKGRGDKEMEDAMYAKFTQNEELKKVLLATKRAKLTHFTRGSPPVTFNNLMRVRQKLL